MLRKLIKYDLKSLNRFLIIIHAFLVLAALFTRLFFTERISLASLLESETDSPQQMSVALMIILYALVVTCVSFATGLIITVRFYKSMFSDEGYLTQTLPVTRGQHLLAKTISGSIWSCIDVFLVFATLYIIMGTPDMMDMIHRNLPEIQEAFGFEGSSVNLPFSALVLLLLLFSFLGAIANVIMYYTSVVLGQLFSGHRVLGAVSVYFAISTVAALILTPFMVILGHSPLYSSTGAGFSQSQYFRSMLILMTTFSIVTSVVLYAISYWVMNKKLNLA